MADALSVLATARKVCRICVDRHPDHIFNGSREYFDPPVASYWAQWLGHEAPKLLIVGQDFGAIGYFRKHQGRDEPNNSTNNNLRELLCIAGLRVGAPPTRDRDSPVFLTNSILCLKKGPMNAPIRDEWVRSCSHHHLVPLLAHLSPPIIVAMGKHGWMALRLAFKLNSAPNLISKAAGGSWITRDGQTVFAVGHCGPLGRRNRPKDQQEADWKKIGQAIAKLGRPVA